MQLGVVRAGLFAIQVSGGHAAPVELLDTLAGALAQLVDRAELDRLSRARLGTSRDQAVALTVVAERAFVRMAVEAGPSDHAEGARRDAVRAAVADVGLDVDVFELVVDDGAGRAGLLTG